MSKNNFYHILSTNVIKDGMRIKSCLDMSKIAYKYDDGGELTKTVDWYEGIVRYTRPNYNDGEYEGFEVAVEKDCFKDDETWTIILTEDNMNKILVYFKEWDD